MSITKKCIRNLFARALCVLMALFMALGMPAQAARSANTFVLGVVSQAGATLNPLLCNQRDLVSLNEMVFESVITLDDYLQPKGELALSWKFDKGTCTFNLRDNVRFHDGTYMTAQDVYETYRYIVSLGEKNCPYYNRVSYISQMEVVSTTELRVTGKYDSYLVLYAMTFPVLQRYSLGQELPYGTGPYWYIHSDENYIQIDANPLWWKIAPTYQTICAYRYDETGDALQALSMGEIDGLATRSQTAALGRLLADRTSTDYTTLTYEMLIPNLNSSLFQNVYTRQAFMYAIDITTIASNIYMDMVTESEVPVVPGSWLYEPQSAVYYESKERALQLLQQAGWGDFNEDGILDQVVNGILEQFEFTLLTYVDDNAATRTHAAELIRDQLRELGIVINVSTQSKSNVQKKLKSGDFDLVLGAVNLSVLPDLTFILNSGGRMCYSNYTSIDMNAFLNNVYTTTDEEMFKTWYSKIQMQVVQDVPYMGLFFRKGTFMTTANISGTSGVIEGDVLRGLEFVERIEE